MIRTGYDLDPTEIDIAVQWLERNDPEEAIPLKDVLALAAAPGGQPGNKNAAKENESGNTRIVSSLGKKNNAAYTVARLARDAVKDPRIAEIYGLRKYSNNLTVARVETVQDVVKKEKGAALEGGGFLSISRALKDHHRDRRRQRSGRRPFSEKRHFSMIETVIGSVPVADFATFSRTCPPFYVAFR